MKRSPLNFSLTDVESITLGNGLKVLIRPDRTAPIVTTMLWYKVGSRTEKPGQTGVSHFLEHMLFKGTKQLPKGAIDELTAWNGGFNNAFTGRDYTVYVFSFAADRWRSALDMETDRMVNALLLASEFELEKEVILEEIRIALDDPWELMRQATDALAFGEHPYRNPILGNPEDVSKLSLTTLADHYREYYVPGNATVVIVGDIKIDEAIKHVEKTLGRLPSKPAAESICRAQPKRMPERLEVRKPAALRRLMIALPAPAIYSADLCSMHLIDRILSDGKLSRLYVRLVDEGGLASRATSEIEETLDPYHLFVRIELEDGVDSECVVQAVFEELEKLCERNLEESELKKAKNQCLAQILNDLETTFDQAFQLGMWETLSHWKGLNEYLAGLESVGPEQIRSTAGKYCDPTAAIVCVAVPDFT